MPRLEWHWTPIECHLASLAHADLRLVVDVIRHYQRVVFRGFAATREETWDVSRLFPFPTPGEWPFFASADGAWVVMDPERQRLDGQFPNPPLAFQLTFTLHEPVVRALTPTWLSRVPGLRWLDPTAWLSLLQEDVPLVNFTGRVRLGAQMYHLQKARGAIAHHWGWAFPNFLFLVCNAFEDPATLLTLGITEAITRLGAPLTRGYLFLRHQGRQTTLVAPRHGQLLPFAEGGQLVMVARWADGRWLRVTLDPGDAVTFPSLFNRHCLTRLNAACTIEGVGPSAQVVLDVKGPAFTTLLEACGVRRGVVPQGHQQAPLPPDPREACDVTG